MGGTQLGFGTPIINPAQSLTFGTPWAASPYGVHAPQQQLLQSLQQLVQLEYVQQQQLLQFVPQKIHLLQQIQQLVQFAAQQHQPFLSGGFPISSFMGPSGWLGATQGVQPPVFGGQPGYVM